MSCTRSPKILRTTPVNIALPQRCPLTIGSIVNIFTDAIHEIVAPHRARSSICEAIGCVISVVAIDHQIKIGIYVAEHRDERRSPLPCSVS